MNPLKMLSMIAVLCFLNINGVLAEEAKVTLNLFEGAVHVARAGEAIAVKEGALLAEGDVVRTENGGQVDIAWNERWAYRLLGNSHCVLKSTEKLDADIEMVEGDIILNIKKLPEGGRLKVSTPTAIAAVRGTQFWGRVTPLAEKTTFAVREGIVEITVKETNQTFEVAAGSALDILSGQSGASVVRNALPGEMNAMAQADEIKMETIES